MPIFAEICRAEKPVTERAFRKKKIKARERMQMMQRCTPGSFLAKHARWCSRFLDLFLIRVKLSKMRLKSPNSYESLKLKLIRLSRFLSSYLYSIASKGFSIVQWNRESVRLISSGLLANPNSFGSIPHWKSVYLVDWPFGYKFLSITFSSIEKNNWFVSALPSTVTCSTSQGLSSDDFEKTGLSPFFIRYSVSEGVFAGLLNKILMSQENFEIS